MPKRCGNELADQGLPTKELDQAIDQLRQLADPRVLEDTRAAADLRAKTIRGFQDFEFGLRRALGDGDSTRVLLERSGDVPPAFKQNVEEYYRAIGRGKPTTPTTPTAPTSAAGNAEAEAAVIGAAQLVVG